MLFLLSSAKSAFPVAYQFLEARGVSPVIPSGIDYLVRQRVFLRRLLRSSSVSWAMLILNKLVYICIPKGRMRFWV